MWGILHMTIHQEPKNKLLLHHFDSEPIPTLFLVIERKQWLFLIWIYKGVLFCCLIISFFLSRLWKSRESPTGWSKSISWPKRNWTADCKGSHRDGRKWIYNMNFVPLCYLYQHMSWWKLCNWKVLVCVVEATGSIH